jgi:hypothetical protein
MERYFIVAPCKLCGLLFYHSKSSTARRSMGIMPMAQGGKAPGLLPHGQDGRATSCPALGALPADYPAYGGYPESRPRQNADDLERREQGAASAMPPGMRRVHHAGTGWPANAPIAAVHCPPHLHGLQQKSRRIEGPSASCFSDYVCPQCGGSPERQGAASLRPETRSHPADRARTLSRSTSTAAWRQRAHRLFWRDCSSSGLIEYLAPHTSHVCSNHFGFAIAINSRPIAYSTA